MLACVCVCVHVFKRLVAAGDKVGSGHNTFFSLKNTIKYMHAYTALSD